MTKQEWIKLVRNRWQSWDTPRPEWPAIAHIEWQKISEAWNSEKAH